VIGFVGGLEGAGVNPLSVLMGVLSVRGINVGSREHFLNLLDHFAVTKVKPVVDRTFPLEKAVDAYKYVESGSHFGKVVITL
jgi:NADPH:quinone reductase-like Zn-dependent oxidoreductase